MNTIDLRSDTVTWPTPTMREAMAHATLGDDVYGDDPTVNRLQELAAEMVGMEAGLFVPSGTMGNLAAALAHCNRGDEVILGNKAHTFLYEAGGISVLGGIHSHQLPNQPDGTLALADLESAIRSDDDHYPISRAIFLENTHNACGGVPIPADYFRAVRELADRHGLIVHLDGARLFNASAAFDCPVTDLTAPVDSVTFCLSKGLCAPVGSILCGRADFITRARRARKMLGGGMRQAGVLAAAGIIALQKMTGRLTKDHANARRLAQNLARVAGIDLDPQTVKTNMVFFKLNADATVTVAELVTRLAREHNIVISADHGDSIRLVTHYWITGEGVDKTVAAFQSILGSAG